MLPSNGAQNKVLSHKDDEGLSMINENHFQSINNTSHSTVNLLVLLCITASVKECLQVHAMIMLDTRIDLGHLLKPKRDKRWSIGDYLVKQVP